MSAPESFTSGLNEGNKTHLQILRKCPVECYRAVLLKLDRKIQLSEGLNMYFHD